jgi:hypothetical protein
MKLVELDTLDAKVTQTAFDCMAQVCLVVVDCGPMIVSCRRAAPNHAALCSDDKISWIRL